MIKDAYEKSYKLLKKNAETLDAIAEVLIEKENLTGEEFMKLFEKHQNIKLKQVNSES